MSWKEETNHSEVNSELEAELSSWSFGDGGYSGTAMRKAR